MVDKLDGFGISFEELSEFAEELREKRGQIRDQRICVCGHPMTRHSNVTGRSMCAPTRMSCPCGSALPVITVSDTRPFLRKTRGWGRQHALMQGLFGLLEKDGREWSWVEGMPTCMMCRAEGVSVMPYALDRFDQPSLEPEKTNVLLCGDCGTKVTQPKFEDVGR